MTVKNNFDFLRLLETIRRIENDLREGQNQWERQFYVPDDYDKFDQESAKIYLKGAWRAILSLYELQGHNVLLGEALQEYSKFNKNPLASAKGPEEPYLIWEEQAWQHLKVLRTLYEEENDNQKMQTQELMGILRRSEAYILSPRLFTWKPIDERDVHERIESCLKCFYPDLKPKPRISKPIKNFDPDTGIPSIKTLLEYKYLLNSDDAKRIADEVFADLGGYHGPEYKKFIFVIYETERFYSQEDWQSFLKTSGSPDSINIVLIKGSPPTKKDYQKAENHRKEMKLRPIKGLGATKRKKQS